MGLSVRHIVAKEGLDQQEPNLAVSLEDFSICLQILSAKHLSVRHVIAKEGLDQQEPNLAVSLEDFSICLQILSAKHITKIRTSEADIKAP